MSDADTVRDEPTVVERRSGHVAWIEMNRPEKRNAVDADMRARLASAFAAASSDPEVRVVVLTGRGPAFCAGMDLGAAASDERHALLRDTPPLVGVMSACTKPVIAAVNGHAVGGGFELALAAEMRVASPAATFRLTEIRIGSLPGSGGTQRIFRALPHAVAWKVLLTGAPLDAAAAATFGLVSDVFDEDSFLDEVEEIAQRVAAAAPLSLRAATLAGRAAASGGMEDGLVLERSLWATLSMSEDRAEGRAAFREKREPHYRGR